jgi:hypothetical protein
VVGQLAKRHDIQVTLRRNPYGGTTAIVLLPHGLVVAEGFGELEPAKALEVAPPMLGRYPAEEQNGLADEAATEPDLPGDEGPGEAAVAGAAPLAYQTAPPAAAAPPITAPPAAAPPAAAPPSAVPPRAEAGQLPSAEAGEPDRAEAESRAWNGLDSPTWNGPPQPANPPARNGTHPPVLPRRVREASLAQGLRDGPPTYSSLPGRIPGPLSPEDTRITVTAVQPNTERGRPMSGQGDGRPQQPGAAEAGAASSSGAAEASGAGSSGAAEAGDASSSGAAEAGDASSSGAGYGGGTGPGGPAGESDTRGA